MIELELQETPELLLGTWVTMALLVEILIDRGTVTREELLCLLAQAEGLSRDRRRTAIAGVRLLVERGFG
jgi:hypothetical protein